MKLFLVRHAQAVSGSPDDPTRSLTDTGFAQAEKVANWLSEELPKMATTSALLADIAVSRRSMFEVSLFSN